MGVSGPGNFDDDDAHIYPYLLKERLRKDVEDCFLAHESGKLDLYDGNSTLMPAMDILVTLCEHYGTSLNLDKVRVRNRKTAYLQLYDDQIDDLGPRPSYRQKRRAVIEETFTQFEEVCLTDSDEVDEEL